MVLLLKGHPFPNTLHSDLGILVICNRNHLLFLPSFCGSKNILVPNLWGVAPGAFPVGKKITPVDKLGHFRCLYINVFWQKGQPTEGRGSTSCKRPTIHFSVNGYHHTRGLATVSIVHLRLGVEPTPTLGPGHKNHRKKNPHAQHAPGPEAFVRRKLGNPKRGFGRGDVCMKQTWNKNDA